MKPIHDLARHQRERYSDSFRVRNLGSGFCRIDFQPVGIT